MFAVPEMETWWWLLLWWWRRRHSVLENGHRQGDGGLWVRLLLWMLQDKAEVTLADWWMMPIFLSSPTFVSSSESVRRGGEMSSDVRVLGASSPHRDGSVYTSWC